MAWCPEPRICCTNSLTGPALHRTNKCSLRALNCRFRGTFCEFITRGTLCRLVQVAFFCVWGRDRIGEAAAGWKIMFARQLLDSTDWGLVHTLDCCPAFHCAAACCSEAKYLNCDPVFQCCKLQRVTSSGRKKAAFCSISSLYSCPTPTVHVYATQPGSNTHSCLNSKPVSFSTRLYNWHTIFWPLSSYYTTSVYCKASSASSSDGIWLSRPPNQRPLTDLSPLPQWTF